MEDLHRRLTNKNSQRRLTNKSSQRSFLTRKGIMVKLNTSFLFGHKGAVVISLVIWITFTFEFGVNFCI